MSQPDLKGREIQLRQWVKGPCGPDTEMPWQCSLHAELLMIERIHSAEKERDALRDACEKVMIGGNHLAAAMLAECPPTNFKNYGQALKAQGQPYADMWVAWNAIMQLRAALTPEQQVKP